MIFACRDEDWIVPMAYAAKRAYGKRPTKPLLLKLSGYMAKGSKYSKDDRVDVDQVEAMREADEAGDLEGYARLVLSNCEPKNQATRQFKQLLDYRLAWKGWIAQLIGADNTVPLVKQTGPNADKPPAPGPIVDQEDPQKGRWGGKAEDQGRSVRAVVDSLEKEKYYFSLIVESTDGSDLEGPVVFHLHNSFPRSVVTTRSIVGKKRAMLKEWWADGVFAVGVQVKNARGKWISLEIDLATLPRLPKRFMR